jgi:hypothetical protein
MADVSPGRDGLFASDVITAVEDRKTRDIAVAINLRLSD